MKDYDQLVSKNKQEGALGVVSRILTNLTSVGADIFKSAPLLNYDKDTNGFSLDPAGLRLLQGLTQPIQVVSAIGDARVGKSTAMNIVQHLWSNRPSNQFTEVFKTGGTFRAVTRGVDAYVVREKGGMERVILDVEGTDLGDDSITDHLSIFTALMSSGMTFFMRDAVKTHSIDFLYRMSRLSDVIFKDEVIKNYPRLRVVLRGALASPPGLSVEDYVKQALVGARERDGSDEKRRAISQHFPREHIEVSLLEDVQDRSLFKDFTRLASSDYMKSMEVLAETMELFPVKKTVNGGLMDGRSLAELAVKLVEAMANGTLHDFGNVYVMVEKHLCDRRYEIMVKPEINGDAQSMRKFLQTGFKAFEKECALRDYITATKVEFTRIAETKESLEKKQKELELETQRRKQEKEKRLKEAAKFEKDKNRMNQELATEKAQRLAVEEESNKINQRAMELQHEIASLQDQVRHSEQRLKDLQDSGGGFFGFIDKIVDTVVKIAIPFKVLGGVP
ncbi:predicted protein [Nematostella vectensis]|uniref:Guanylate-binding protein N-terminal domain-containing protein n=1 Tax=Nematostella vectensis TaxID=45351 RepID=A7RXK1_NEMVE|nr:predicted protein [Nematostella vectensis]|eukprot:XP_001635852.1 predicted protein [Nematostella vectensis]